MRRTRLPSSPLLPNQCHRTLRKYAMAVLLLGVALPAQASDGHGPGPAVWLLLAAILIAAKLGGEVAQRLKQPPVLGELFAGVLLGNLSLVGIQLFEGAEQLPPVLFLAELGVVLLLFEVGLETTLSEMRRVAPQSGAVAVIGVVAPMGLGYGASYLLSPQAPSALHLFVGATLCATSVGITARVFKDLNVLQRSESQVVLGAAVIDDVLGLVVLAVVSTIAQHGAIPDTLGLLKITGLAFGFLAGALAVGMYLMPGVYRVSARLQTPGVLGALSIAFCLVLSGLSAAAGLAAIVGAFAAGLILDEVRLKPFGDNAVHHLSEYTRPIVAFLAPIFFVRTGMMVQLDGLGTQTLLLAALLLVVAIVGKLVAGWGVRGQGTDRLTVGVGMIPRGEVGLIFINVGASLQVGGKPLIEPNIYAAVVLTVMATTVVTPPWLAQRMRKLVARDSAKATPTLAKHSVAAATTSTPPHG